MESENHNQMTPALDRPDSWSPLGIYKATREEFLNEAAIIMQPWLNVHITPQRVRDHNKDRIVEKKKLRQFKQGCCDFTCARCEQKLDYRAHGILGRYYRGVKGSKPQIYVTDQKAARATKAASIDVCVTLLHEMVHYCAEYHGHKGEFKQLSIDVGLTDKGGSAKFSTCKPTSSEIRGSHATKELRDAIRLNVINVLGKFPQGKANGYGQKRKGSRMLKITCSICDLILRGSAKACMMIEGEPCPGCNSSDYIRQHGFLEVNWRE